MPNLIFSKNLCGFAYPQGSHNRLTLLKDSTVVCGEGHILVAKPNRKPGSYLNIVIPSVRLLFTAICLSNSVQNEQFYVDEPSGEPEVNSQVSPDPGTGTGGVGDAYNTSRDGSSCRKQLSGSSRDGNSCRK